MSNSNSEDDNEPEVPETPPDSVPPVQPVSPVDSTAPQGPERPLIEGMLKALEPVFKQMETAVTNLERRAVDQQKQLEDLAAGTTRLVEEKVISAIKVYEQSRSAADSAQVVPPGQTPFDKPPGAGISGFLGSIFQYLQVPQVQTLIAQYMSPRTPGLITIDANDIFGQSVEKVIRATAVKALQDRFGALPDLSIASEPVHQVVGDHV